MNLTDSDILRFQMGAPIFIEDVCAVYPLTLREIVEEGYENFQQYLNVLTMTKPIEVKDNPEFEEVIQNINDFQYALLLITIDPKIAELFEKGINLFTHSTFQISLEPPQIILEYDGEQHILDEEHFYELQRILRRMYFLDTEDEIIINPDDDARTRKIKMQMRINREKVRRAKAAKAANDKTNLKLSDLIGSMTINNCGFNIVNVWDMTYYAFHDQLKRMGWRDQFNINQKAALAGAKIDKSKLTHWMRSITYDK